MSADIERIRNALAFIPAGGHDERVRMAFAVKSELTDSGFELWDEWYQRRGDAYDVNESKSVWKSAGANGKVTIGTLFHEAKAHGWRDDETYQRPTPEQLAKRKHIEAERAELERAEIAREREVAVENAATNWRAATVAKADHPYLLRKQVAPTTTMREIDAHTVKGILGYTPKSDGVELIGRLLVVPVKQRDTLSTLELVDESGRKAALAGRGTKSGGYWATQPLPQGHGDGHTLLIGEGAATVLSASSACGYIGLAALSSGNLLAVAKYIRERYPRASLVLLSDLVKATGEPDPHAIEAARVVGGKLAIPDFGVDRAQGDKDFNDLHTLRGVEAVRCCIESAVEPLADEPPASSFSGVTGVTGVQPRNDGLSNVTPAETTGVTGVTNAPKSPIPSKEERPTFCTFDEWLEHGGVKFRPGVWYFGTDKDDVQVQSWVCSPLHVEAVTYDGQDNHFGRLLRFRNTNGKWREWAMPMDMLSGDGAMMRAELLAMGVEIDPSPRARNLLASYLQEKPPKRRMRCALQVGWCGDSFVLPDTVIGPNASDVIFQSGERGHDEHTVAGTLEGWRAEIAARAVGNPLLVLALSASFAGPLLARCNTEGGGLHYVGDSSTGKTTAIEAACATWGGPNFRRSWRATANGMEGAASLFNDCLLALDEISECDPKEVGAIVYALGNGRGKQRASRSGAARGVTRWRCVVLSSGERTIGTTMQEGGHRVKAGQAVRLLDIPASRKFGAWDSLHGAASGTAFSDALKRAAATHHGHAGRAYLEKLSREERNAGALLERIKALPAFAAEGGEGQDKRAAGRFALLALAGELATEYELTGWPEGEAIAAAAEAFKLWQSMRGKGNDERRQILGRVSDFIERHGDGRFSDANGNPDVVFRERAGWWRDTTEGREYLFTTEGLREALKGFDFNRATDALLAAGALPAPRADGKRSTTERIKARGSAPIRLYTIKPGKLGGDYGA